MALVYFDRKPVLRYNFTTGSAANEPKCTHQMKGKAKQHRVSKDILCGTIRKLDLPIMQCSTAHS